MSSHVLHLFDTMSRTLQPVVPSDGTTIRFYSCGPTIYDVAHIGNFRTFLFEDLLRRTLQAFGHRVCQVMNLTDVDDKTIKGATLQGVPLKTFTDTFKHAFFEDLDILRIQRAEFYPEATDYIPDMILMIQDLMEKQAAYLHTDGSIYFALDKAANYGKLSHLTYTSTCSCGSARDEYSSDEAADFVLWKAYDAKRDGNISWESPWGKGRPGWHIECSVMAKKLLGDTIDLHAGGVDLIFPHHENEIAQSETSSGKLFSHHWAHAEHLLVDHKKMSKSLGNFYTLRDILAKGYLPSAIRYFLLSNHYRTQLNFTLPSLDGAFASVKRIRDFVDRLTSIAQASGPTSSLSDTTAHSQEAFYQALANDLNTNEALGVVFEYIRLGNHALDNHTMTPQDAHNGLMFFSLVDAIFDIITPDKASIPDIVLELLQLRQQARKDRNWAKSDELRAAIEQHGYCIEDNPSGQKITRTAWSS